MSFLLVLVMVYGMLPMTAMAAETVAEETVVVTDVGTLAEETPTENTQPEEPVETPTVTRAQWLQFLVTTFDYTVGDDVTLDNYYTDLSSDAAYYQDVMIAVHYGLVDVLSNGALRPEDPATREFAAQTLNTCMGYLPEAEGVYTYSESAAVTYPDDIQVAVERGWFALADGAFLPEQAITLDEQEVMRADAESYVADLVIDAGYDNAYTFKEGVIEITEYVEIAEEEDCTRIFIYDCRKTLTGITIPRGVSAINSDAFNDCDALVDVVMANTVTTLGKNAFYHCDILKNVTLSRNLTSIPEGAFQQCAELETIVIPYFTTTIAKKAFNSSPKLSKVVTHEALTSIASGAFSYADVTEFYAPPVPTPRPGRSSTATSSTRIPPQPLPSPWLNRRLTWSPARASIWIWISPLPISGTPSPSSPAIPTWLLFPRIVPSPVLPPVRPL